MAFVKKESGPSLGERISKGVTGAASAILEGLSWKQQYEFNQQKAEELKLKTQQMQQEMDATRRKGEEVATQQWGDFLVNMSQSKDPEQFLNVNSSRANQLLQYVPGANKMNQEQIIEYSKHLQSNLADPLKVIDKAKASILNIGASTESVRDAYEMGSNAIAQVKNASPYETYPIWDAKKNVLDQLMEKRFGGEVAMRAATFKAETANKPNPRENRLTREQILREVNKFEASPDLKPLRETLISSTKAEKLLNQKNLSNAVEPVKIMLAAAFNQGRPTDRDAEAMAQNPSVWNAIERFSAKKGLNVNIEEDREQFKILANALIDWAQARYQRRVREWASGTAGLLDLPEQDLADIALKRGGYAPGKEQAKPAAASAQKSIAKKLFSPSRNQTKIVYSDGSEEVVSGQR